MNIDDFYNDINSLLDFYKDNFGESDIFLKYWIEARKYSEEEFQFLYFLVETRQQNVLSENLMKAEEFNDSKLLFNEESEALYAIKESLKAYANIESYPFQNVDQEYLVAGSRNSLLIVAEKWAIDNGFMSSEGKWQKNNNSLATFLQILVDRKIIRSKKRKEIDHYFSKRYNQGELLGDQFKISKIRSAKKHDQFESLLKSLEFPED